MPAAGEYADTLRAIGRFLDIVGACDIAVIERGEGFLVSWSGTRPEREMRHLGPAELGGLRSTARLFRGLAGPSPRFSVATLLRVLGTVADELHPRSVAITEAADGFRISVQTEAGPVQRFYHYAEIVRRANRYHRHRPGPA